MYVDAEAVGTKRALNYWIGLAVKFNQAQKVKNGREKRTRFQDSLAKISGMVLAKDSMEIKESTVPDLRT